jgi:predicted xylose isomerase-like sugar epimerase
LTAALGVELRSAGVNALIVDESRVGAADLAALRNAASRAGILLVVVNTKHPTHALTAERLDSPSALSGLPDGVVGQRVVALTPLGSGSFSSAT